MTTSSVSSSSTVDWTQFMSQTQQKKDPTKDFQTLQDALESGDLEAAKSAFATLQKNMPPPPPDGAAPQGKAQGVQGSGGKGDDQRKADFEALQKALESGDLEAAQSAFATIQERMQQGDQQASTASHSISTDGVGSVFDLIA